MALKADRIHVDSQIDFFMNEVAERGGLVCASTVGSGAAMDQAAQLCTYVGTAVSGKAPLGVLMCDMVNLDLTRQHKNFHKEEVQIGGKVTIWNKCTVVTNKIDPGTSPTTGQVAYLGPSGTFRAGTPLATDHSNVSNQPVGRFLSTKDEDGFAKVSVNLP